MRNSTENPKIAEMLAELRELKKEHHGFVMAIAREADVNYNNLSSMISVDEDGRPKRKMGYHVFFAIHSALPRVKREFAKKKAKEK